MLFKLVSLFLIGAALFFSVAHAEAADNEIDLIINDKKTQVESLFIRDGRVYAPLGPIAREMGASVIWDNENNTVRINQDLGDRYLKGLNISNGTGAGIYNNLIKATELKAILDDNKNDDLADYRDGHSGGDILSNDPLVVDLRNKEDYDTRHIPGAVWVAEAENIAEPQNIEQLISLLETHIAKGGKNEIVVYCSTGNTSGLVAGILGSRGLPVKNLMYGFDISWRGTGKIDYPVFAPMEDNTGQIHLCGG